MFFFRNPEVKRSIIVCCFLIIVSTAVTAFTGGTYLNVLIVSVLFTIYHFAAAFMLYLKIRKLSRDIDAIINGNYCIKFDNYREGELSILSDEIYKVLSRIIEQDEMLKNDKLWLSDSVADISHQLRTPLTSINILLSVMTSPETNEEKRLEIINQLRRKLTRVEWLIDSLLKISRLDASAVVFANDRLVVSDVVKQAYDTVAVAMEIKNQKFTVTGMDSVISGDRMWLVEAVSNILKNCMEHTPCDGYIEITMNETNIYSEIIIKDSGSGFKEEDIPHLFERFYKGSNSSEDSFGIGLCLAKKIINAANGTVKAQNYSNGAMFSIRFFYTKEV